MQNVTTGQVYALKKMFVQSKEQLQDAQWEIEVQFAGLWAWVCVRV